ncbi:MAG: ATP-dependent Clp protease ATP-binding subunit ClpX [candidate division TM6 bacterium GW2011_GWF2_30_66]|nr:MAG: ATP-dependent Clp protease ATP-binding subunit ClpX [candidate division TM6 bacterium GW2011_GWF2_30_66]
MLKKTITKLFQKKLQLLTAMLFLLNITPIAKARGGGESVDEAIYNKIDYAYTFDQSNILSKYPEVLINEGLNPITEGQKSNKISKESSCSKAIKDQGVKILKKLLASIDFCNMCTYKNSKKCYGKISNCCKKHNNSANYTQLPTNDIDDPINNIANNLTDDAEELKTENGSREEPKFITEIEENNYEENKKASEKLDQELLQDYRAKKKLSMLISLGEPIFRFGTYGAFFGTASCLLKESFGFSAGIFVNIIANAFEEFTKAFCNVFGFEPNDSLKIYEELYTNKKRFLHPTLQKSIENNFRLGRECKNALGEITRYFDIALNVPLKSHKIKHPSKYKNELNNLLDCYDYQVKEDLLTAIQGHHDRFSSVAKSNARQKIILYLQGPPGLGKTFVTQSISKLMGLPIISLDATDNIIGNSKEPGKLLEAICSPDTPRNAIIFIDEANHLIEDGKDLAAIKSLLEPSKTHFKSPYLNAEIDISHFCFILAGNSEIKVNKEKDNGALLSRFKTIHINKMDETSKTKIILDTFNKIVGLNNEKTLLEELSKLIISRISENKNPGVREILTEGEAFIDNYRRNKNTEILSEETKKAILERTLKEKEKNEYDEKERKLDEEMAKLEKVKKIMEKSKNLIKLKEEIEEFNKKNQ